MTLAGPFKRLAKAIGRPLWNPLKARIEMLIRSDAHLEQRLSALGARVDSADQSIARMRLETNHVPVLDRRVALLEPKASALGLLVAAMKLQTDHVPVLDGKVAALESLTAQFGDLTSIIDFRLGQQRRDIDEKYAAELYIARQDTHDLRAHYETLARQFDAFRKDGAPETAERIKEQLAQLRAAVGKLEAQFLQLGQLRAAVSKIDALHSQFRTSLARSREGEEPEEPGFEQSKLAQDWVVEEWKYLSPMDVNGKQFTRVGRRGDGGYVMLDDLAKAHSALSFGVGTEISWDLELAERGINVLLYDHTIQDIPTHHPNVKFRPFGLSAHEDHVNGKRPLSQILNEEHVSASNDNILKIDIEGSEWDALREIAVDSLEHFSQILLELHGMSEYSDPNNHINRMYVLKKLHQTHQVVHLHANNWGDYKIIGGAAIPDVLEVTLASRKRYSFSPCTRTFPTSLDYPNNADRADIFLTLPVSGGPDAEPTRSKMQ